jgi:hypothetical protein
MKCHHRPCTCSAATGRNYCSTECESDTRDEGATECHCGHEHCSASEAGNRDSTRD